MPVSCVPIACRITYCICWKGDIQFRNCPRQHFTNTTHKTPLLMHRFCTGGQRSNGNIRCKCKVKIITFAIQITYLQTGPIVIPEVSGGQLTVGILAGKQMIFAPSTTLPRNPGANPITLRACWQLSVWLCVRVELRNIMKATSQQTWGWNNTVCTSLKCKTCRFIPVSLPYQRWTTTSKKTSSIHSSLEHICLHNIILLCL